MQKRKINSVFFLLCVFASLRLIAVPCHAATLPRIEVNAEIGWSGWIKQGRWAPAFITLANRGPKTRVRVDLLVPAGAETSHTYTKEITLPSPSRRTEVMYFRATRLSGEVRLRVREISDEQPNRTLFRFEKEFGPELVASNQPLVLELSESRAGENANLRTDVMYGPFGNISSVQVVYHAPKFWPDRWYGYDCLDAIVLSDYTPRKLGATELSVIEQWIKLGGRFAVLGGETGVAVKGTRLEEMLPVHLTGKTRLIELANDPWSQQTKWKGQTLIAESTARKKTTPAIYFSGWYHGPRLKSRRYGEGAVFFLDFNDLRPPIAGSRGWKNILASLGMNYSPWSWASESEEYNGYIWGGPALVISDVPALEIPSRRSVTSLLLLYVLLLGPVHWLIGRKTKKLVGWLTFPATIALFTFVTYRHGRSIKGTHVLVNEVAIAQTDSEAPYAHVQSLFGVLSPDDRSYTLSATDKDTLISRPPAQWGNMTLNIASRLRGQSRAAYTQPGIPYGQPYGGAAGRLKDEPQVNYRLTDRLAISNVRIKWGAMELFRAESVEPLNNGILSQLRLNQKTGRLAGTVENRTPLDLEECLLIFNPQQSWRIDRIKPGERLSVDRLKHKIAWQEYERAFMRPYGGNKNESPRKRILRSLAPQFWSGQPTLIGFVKNPPQTLKVEPGRVERRKWEVLVVRLAIKDYRNNLIIN